ncbi:GTP-binding protein [Paenibacillus polymyxa]|uniref:GTP-binding protein n=1 Tax=Paenibacillus polymyxa TaxID=1406 RepID=UPI0023790B66|nr:GTP-binding protein [Paenibacillus polymyxa]
MILPSPEKLERLEKALRGLQPNAKIIRSEYDEVDPKEILNTHRFDFETASQAGSSKQFARAGLWISALAEEERQYNLGEDFEKIPDWDKKYGDRVTKLVFIGIDMNREEMERTLNKTLLAPEEIEQDWRKLPDPFTKKYNEIIK